MNIVLTHKLCNIIPTIQFEMNNIHCQLFLMMKIMDIHINYWGSF